MSTNTNTAGNRHGAIERTLAGSLASFMDTRDALAEAQKRFSALDQADAPDQKVGQARREVKRLSGQLEEQQHQHRKLAEEELAARYAWAEERQRHGQRAGEELRERETSLTVRLSLATGQLTEAEARLHDHGAKGRALSVGPLKWHVEGQAKEALAQVTKAKKKVKELAAELTQVKTQRGELAAELAFVAATLEQLLKESETQLRELSLEKLDAQLADPHVTVDRLAVEELLAKWARGFTEMEEPYLAAPYRVTYYPRGASIYYWFNTGFLAATSIFDCPPKAGSGQWSKVTYLLTFADVRDRLEREGQAGVTQPAGAAP
jgi:hypothetical protein